MRFTFKPGGDREMPLIMGLMPILPKHAIDPERFEQTTLNYPIGSGPYKVEKIEPGARIVYRRDEKYWARDLPSRRGLFNFERVQFDYYRDVSAMLEAFKKGLIRVKGEGDPGRWTEAYTGPAFDDARILKKTFDIKLPSGMAALAFNTRRKPFDNPKVRQALIQLFDFEWLNKNLYHGLYTRTQSFFDRSELSSYGQPASDKERELLAPYLAEIKPEILDGTHRFPKTDGSGRNRKAQRAALKLLGEAGFRINAGKLTGPDGVPLTIELLAVSSSQEKLFLTFARTLKRLGITAEIRTVDSAIYQRRIKSYEFDMIQTRWGASLSPGNEQSFRWASKAADTEGTFNYPGVKSAAVDAMIQAVLEARSRPDFVAAVRALDRALLSGDYVIPLFHLPKQLAATWHDLKAPETTSLYGYQLDTWWHEPN